MHDNGLCYDTPHMYTMHFDHFSPSLIPVVHLPSPPSFPFDFHVLFFFFKFVTQTVSLGLPMYGKR